jgi:hypothetical protein
MISAVIRGQGRQQAAGGGRSGREGMSTGGWRGRSDRTLTRGVGRIQPGVSRQPEEGREAGGGEAGLKGPRCVDIAKSCERRGRWGRKGGVVQTEKRQKIRGMGQFDAGGPRWALPELPFL